MGLELGGAREATEESEGSKGLQRLLFQPPDPRSEPTAPPIPWRKTPGGDYAVPSLVANAAS